MSFWGTVAAAASTEQGGAAAAYTCPSKARLWNSIIESLLGKRKAKIAGEGGELRAPSKLNLQEQLKVLRQALLLQCIQIWALSCSKQGDLGGEAWNHACISQYVSGSDTAQTGNIY